MPDNGQSLRELVVHCARKALVRLEAAGHRIETHLVPGGCGSRDEWDLPVDRVVMIIEGMSPQAKGLTDDVEPIIRAELFEPITRAGARVVRAVSGDGLHLVEEEEFVPASV